MNDIIHYNNCPACFSNRISFVLKAKDETVSKKLFEVWECADCTLRFTQDVPNENTIGDYYKSSAYISHSNTSKGFINKLYHTVRSYTLESKRKLIEKNTVKGSLLDIGAGTGAFASTMKKAGWNVTALEPDEDARSTAKKDFSVELLSIENLFSLQKKSFNVITLWHVLEHVHELHTYLDTFFSLLVDGGTLIIAVPNYTSYDAKNYKENWAAYDAPRHLYHFSPQSMQTVLSRHNFKLVQTKPMWFDSFYVSLLSEQYKNGKSNFLSAVIKGAISNSTAISNNKNCSSIIYVAKK